MAPPIEAAAADPGGAGPARGDWRALRRLIEDGSLVRAAEAVHAAQRGFHRLGAPGTPDGWGRAERSLRAARARLAAVAAEPDLVAFVRSLRDTDRRALAGPIKAYARELLGRQSVSTGWSTTPWEVRGATAYALRVAGAGCFTGAEATAQWLARRDLQGWSFALGADAPTAIVGVLRDRDPGWLADIANRLAARLRPDDRQRTARSQWEITAALVRQAGIDPPTTDGFVYGWVLARMSSSWPGDPDHRRLVDRLLVDRLRDDPWLDLLVPCLFEANEAGELLAWGLRPSSGVPAEQTWPVALARLAAEGRLDRAALLDRCLGRLLRGGRPNALVGFVRLHEALDPDLDELAARVRDYRRLLPDAPPAVAELAQGHLRQLDDAGRLDPLTLIDATRAVLFRPERKLVRAQLTWVDAAARRRREQPDELGGLLSAATVAFGQEAADLQQRAVSLMRKHARHASRAARAEVLDAASALPDDLRQRVAEALDLGEPVAGPGQEQDAAAGPVGPPAAVAVASPAPLPKPVTRPLPPPIGSPAELAEELAVLLHTARVDRSIGRTLDPIALERVLAAIVGFAHADRAALRHAVAPVLLRYVATPPDDVPDPWSWNWWSTWLRSDDNWHWSDERATVGLIAAAATISTVGPATGMPAPPRDEWLPLALSLRKGRGRQPSPRARRAIMHRLREIGIGLLYEPVPTLLATPTTASGQVDPAVLFDKIARAEREGWQPWELDLQQALLRLPGETDPMLLDRARRLHSPAGRRLARRLETGGPPQPTLGRVVHTFSKNGQHWVPRAVADRTMVLAVEPSPPPARAGGVDARPASPSWAPSLAHLLLDLDPPGRFAPPDWWGLASGHTAALCWPSLLPGHRDLIAAHLLPALSLLPRHGYSRGFGAVLPLLAEGDGPVGIGLTLALALALGARDRADRAAAADALVILAARGQLDGAALGRELADLVTLGLFPVQRLVEPLRDVARSGASTVLWALLSAALPRLLPPAVDRAPQRLPDLVALGAETAALARAGEPIPALAAVAERGGSSRLAAESRRLHAILTSG